MQTTDYAGRKKGELKKKLMVFCLRQMVRQKETQGIQTKKQLKLQIGKTQVGDQRLKLKRTKKVKIQTTVIEIQKSKRTNQISQNKEITNPKFQRT